jgi:hypothetical protein
MTQTPEQPSDQAAIPYDPNTYYIPGSQNESGQRMSAEKLARYRRASEALGGRAIIDVIAGPGESFRRGDFTGTLNDDEYYVRLGSTNPLSRGNATELHRKADELAQNDVERATEL